MARKKRTREEIIKEARNRREAQRKEALANGYVVEKSDALQCEVHHKSRIIEANGDFNGYVCSDCVRSYLETSLKRYKDALTSGITPMGRDFYEKMVGTFAQGLSDLENKKPFDSFLSSVIISNIPEVLGYDCFNCGIAKGKPYTEEHHCEPQPLSGREGTTYNCHVCREEVGTCGPMTYRYE